MTCCKKIPIPDLNISDLDTIQNMYLNGKKVFNSRYNLPNWRSLYLINDYKQNSLYHKLPNIRNWLIYIEDNYLEFKGIKNCYLSILEPKSSIPWHTDMSTDVFNDSFLTSLKTKNSFIEFENDKKYTYKTGSSYVIRSAVSHRILNLSNEIRITLCTTPTENPYA